MEYIYSDIAFVESFQNFQNPFDWKFLEWWRCVNSVLRDIC